MVKPLEYDIDGAARQVREYLRERDAALPWWGRATQREVAAAQAQVLKAMRDLGLAPPAHLNRQDVAARILNQIMQIGPATWALHHPDVSDVEIVGDGYCRVELAGQPFDWRQRYPDHTGDPWRAKLYSPEETWLLATRLALLRGVALDEANLEAQLDLPNELGRCLVILGPHGRREGLTTATTIVIRKPMAGIVALGDLLERRALSEEAAEFLRKVVGHCNFVVSGPKGSGKTTLLGILSGIIPSTETLTVIENGFRELRVQHDGQEIHFVVRDWMERVDAAELVATAVTRIKGHIWLGEMVREVETLQMLEAARQGARIAFTVHSPSGAGTTVSLEEKMLAAVGTRFRDVIADQVDLILHMRAIEAGPHADRIGTRVVSEIIAVEGLTPDGEYTFTNVQGYDVMKDEFTSFRVPPRLRRRLTRSGIAL